MAGRKAYDAFLTKWSTLCPAVARSLRTTNAMENLNREFRRRTKTQASFSAEHAGVMLLYGLVTFGQIRFRKIDGYRHAASLISSKETNAA